MNDSHDSGPRLVVARLALTASLIFSLAGVAQARDITLILSNGDRISGITLEVTAQHIALQTAHSGQVSVVRSSIERIESTQDVAVELNSGERIIGSIHSYENERILITSQALGEQIIALAQVASITPHTEKAGGAPSLGSLSEKRGITFLSEATLSGVRGKSKEGAISVSTDVSKPIGRPEDTEDIRKLFMRQSTVLLMPGEYEIEAGIMYQRSRFNPSGVDMISRILSVPLGLRVGLAEKWQGYANLPVAYGQQQFSNGISESSAHQTGIGDVSAGLNYQLMNEGSGWPDIVATGGFSASTGHSPYADGGAGVALGTGHWSVNMGLQFIKTVDPVAIFGGINYAHQFAGNGLGKRINPGNAYGYNLGMGFAINEVVSLSGEFIGSAQGAMQEDGARVVGSSREPMQFRTGLIYRLTKNWYLAPSLTYGLNRDAPDVILMASFSHRIQ